MKFTDGVSGRPEGSVCSYAGYFSIPTLTNEKAEQIRDAARVAGLDVDIEGAAMELTYEGRDSNRFVVRFLKQVAYAIGTARGEIRCEITGDEGDPTFEFYRISNGRLLRQLGAIVRGPEEDVSIDHS